MIAPSRALVCLLAVASACDRAETQGSDSPAPTSPTPAPADGAENPEPADENADDSIAPGCHEGIDALHQLEGKTEAQLITLYGEPDAKKTFTMADCCHEFEVELYNTYPPGKGHDAVEIHQMTWQDADNLLTVWAHRPKSDWVILDTLCYLDGTDF